MLGKKCVFFAWTLFLSLFLICCKSAEWDPPQAYYVDEFGSDDNDGLSLRTPFRTLQKAVDALDVTGIQTVIVGGTLNGMTVINEANGEIRITGTPRGQATLTSLGPYRTLAVSGLARVRLEHIAVVGNIEAGGILVADGAQLILGEGARVAGNYALRGAGVHVAGGARLTLEGNAVIGRNRAAIEGGGVFVHRGTVYLKGTSAIADNEASSGGGAALRQSRLTLYDKSTIADNTAENDGGGIFAAEESAVAMQFETAITRNKAVYGGGIFLDAHSTFTNNSGQVQANRSQTATEVYQSNQ
jgi:hypothetical protein